MSGLPTTEIDAWIGKAEERWLHPLLGHVESCFQPTFLPSHDHTHHLRVWKTGRQLLKEIAWIREDLDPGLVEGLLIASLFHDAGMHRSTGPDHGKWSRELCAEYFRNEPQPHPARWEEILDAIERHDLKTPEIYPELSSPAPPAILGLLSVADDLEAFGIIGIYRYIEIYLARRTPLSELGIRSRGTRLLVDICKSPGSRHFLAQRSAGKHIDEALFLENEIELQLFQVKKPVYPQLWGPFLNNLSAFDLLFTCGPRAGEYILDHSAIIQ